MNQKIKSLSEAYRSVYLKENPQDPHHTEITAAQDKLFKDYFAVPGRAEAALSMIRDVYEYYTKNPNPTALSILVYNLAIYLSHKK